MQSATSTRARAILVANARAILAALEPYGVPLLVNDRVTSHSRPGRRGATWARRHGADDARRLLGPEAILGVTIHHAHEADGLALGVADYAGCGPVYATASKDPGDPPLGPELARLLAGVRARLPGLPACGIAGSTLNAPAVDRGRGRGGGGDQRPVHRRGRRARRRDGCALRWTTRWRRRRAA